MDRPLDILFLALVAVPGAHATGGIRSIVWNQARWLAARGHRVRIVTTAHPAAVARERREGVDIAYLGVSKHDPRAFTNAAWHAAVRAAWPAVLASGRPDVVHGHAEAERPLVRAGHAGRPGRPPVVATLYGSPLAGVLDHLRIGAARARQRRHPRAWARAAWGAVSVLPTLGGARDYRTGHVVALSRHHARLVRRAYGARRVRVVPPGIDTGRFAPVDGDGRRAARAALGLPGAPDATIWACVGRLGFGKGTDVALAALAAARERAARLIVAGDGPERTALELRSRALGIAGRVHFTGDLGDPRPAYHAADALLFPTRHAESFGLVAAEAMACGLPVLGAARGAVPEVVGDAGMILPADDPAAWAAAMDRWGADVTGRRRSGARGRRRVVARYGHGGAVDALERIYRARLRDAGRGGAARRTDAAGRGGRARRPDGGA